MVRLFRACGYAEAVSFLYLLLVAMPAKYLHGDLAATRVPGAIHGLLFVAYCAFALAFADRENWPRRKLAWAVAAAVLPLGTIVFDWRYLAKESRTEGSN